MERTIVNRFRDIAGSVLLAFSLAGCGGSGSTPPSQNPTQPAPYTGQLAPTAFTIRVPSSTQSAKRKPQYVGAGVKSVTITLNTVNGAAPPAGLTTTVSSNVSLPCAPCSVNGPSAPPGTDMFTLTTYDATGGSGNAISTGSPSLTITAGTANNNTVTLDGIPKSFAFGPMPGGAAGTAFTSPQAFTLTVKDADGNAITGTYSAPITLKDSDTTNSSQGTSISLNGTAGTTGVLSTASTDTFALNYGGLAIAPAVLTASDTGATNGTATFAPTVQPIIFACVPVSSCSSKTNEIDFYAASGTGSTFTWNAHETGWTNAPYNRAIIATSASGCSTIATTATTGTINAFISSVASTPAVGTCTLTLSDFAGGQALPITETYTTSGFGVN